MLIEEVKEIKWQKHTKTADKIRASVILKMVVNVAPTLL